MLGKHAVLYIYIYKHVDQMMYIHVCMKEFGLRGETSNREREIKEAIGRLCGYHINNQTHYKV